MGYDKNTRALQQTWRQQLIPRFWPDRGVARDDCLVGESELCPEPRARSGFGKRASELGKSPSLQIAPGGSVAGSVFLSTVSWGETIISTALVSTLRQIEMVPLAGGVRVL
jgi:hypothetical protein